MVRRRRKGRTAGTNGRRQAGPSHRHGHPRSARHPHAVRRRAPRVGSRGSVPGPRAGCRPGDGRRAGRPGNEPTPPVGRPGSGSRPTAGRGGNESRPPVGRRRSEPSPPVGRPGNGRKPPGAAGWPGCRRSGSRRAGSRRSAGVRRGAGRCRRPRRNHAPGYGRSSPGRNPPREPAPSQPDPNHARGCARPPARNHGQHPDRPPDRNHEQHPEHPSDRNHARSAVRLAGRSLARGRPGRPPGRSRAYGRAGGRPGCRNSGCSPWCSACSPWCSACPPYPGAVRPESRPASAKAPRTDEAGCWVARGHPPPGVAAGGVAQSGRSRSRARDPGGAAGPRIPPPGRSGAEEAGRTDRRPTRPQRTRAREAAPIRLAPAAPDRRRHPRTDAIPHHLRRTDARPAPRCRPWVPTPAVESGPPASRWPRSGRPASRRTDPGPVVWTGGVGPAGAGGWRRGALRCSCTPRFLVPCGPGGRPGARPPVGSGRHAYRGSRPADGLPTPRASHTRGSGSASPSRSSLRARHSTGWPPPNGNQSAGPRLLPGTSPYPAVIMSGRLRA